MQPTALRALQASSFEIAGTFAPKSCRLHVQVSGAWNILCWSVESSCAWWLVEQSLEAQIESQANPCLILTTAFSSMIPVDWALLQLPVPAAIRWRENLLRILAITELEIVSSTPLPEFRKQHMRRRKSPSAPLIEPRDLCDCIETLGDFSFEALRVLGKYQLTIGNPSLTHSTELFIVLDLSSTDKKVSLET